MRLAPGLLTGRLSWLATIIAITIALGLVGCQPAAPEASGHLESTPESTLEGANSQQPVPETTDASASGTPGVFDDRVVFGQSAAFSGPASQLGIGMNLGIAAAFAEANRNGGVQGRQLELVTLDDTYEPELAIINTTRLIEEDRVFALIGAVGTPTSRSATPVALEAGVPYIAPFTGAAFLRDAESLPNVINMRASYNQETEEMVQRLTTDLGLDRIGIMYQEDSFGRAGLNGALAALTKRGMEPAAVGLYPRNTTAVKTGLLDLKQGNPEGVILVGAYRPLAELIAWARHIGVDWEFINISFVGSNALADELGRLDPNKGAGVFVTQVVPFPHDDSTPVVAAYHQALAYYDPEATPGFVSLEGYLAGRLAIAGLERCGSNPDRECFLEGLRSHEPINLDGFELQYGEGDNQGSDTVFLTMIDEEGKYIPLDRLDERGGTGR